MPEEKLIIADNETPPPAIIKGKDDDLIGLNDDIIDDFDEFYETAKSRKQGDRFYNYGKISNDLAKEIKNIKKRDVEGYSLIIQERHLRHIIQRHGENSIMHQMIINKRCVN